MAAAKQKERGAEADQTRDSPYSLKAMTLRCQKSVQIDRLSDLACVLVMLFRTSLLSGYRVDGEALCEWLE